MAKDERDNTTSDLYGAEGSTLVNTKLENAKRRHFEAHAEVGMCVAEISSLKRALAGQRKLLRNATDRMARAAVAVDRLK